MMETLLLLACITAATQDRTDPTRSVVYKTIGDVELKMYLFEPAGREAGDRRPAIVFFHGGGWRGGHPKQFFPQAAYLASRGMVAMSAEYRLTAKHGTTPVECVKDAKSAIRWARAHARELGIDTERIAAGGGSAGGHLAAATGTLEGFVEKGEDASIRARPDAMALFNPAAVLATVEGRYEISREFAARLRDRMGTDPKRLSPAHHVRKGVPPTVIFHGTADTTVPFKTAEVFRDLVKEAGTRCDLVAAKGAGHGYFNRGRHYLETTRELDRFLVSLGWLEGEPTLKSPE